MSEHELHDPVLLAVRKARPAIDDAAISPVSAEALEVLERVLNGEGARKPLERGGILRRARIRPRPDTAGRHLLRPRIGALAAAAAAVAAAAVVVLSGISGGASLVDRAYAAVNPRYQVLHEVDVQTDHGLRGYHDRVEGWLLPADGRARLIHIWGYTSPYVSESVTTAAGHTFERTCLARCRPAAFINGRARWSEAGPPGTFGGTPGTLPGTFAAWFRTAYRDHAVASAGTTGFAGKRVARFQSMAPSFGPRIVFWRPGATPPASARTGTSGPEPYTLIEWYVDPATAQPVGFRALACTSAAARSCRLPVSTTRIVTFELLDPTPQNLALLTGPNAPRAAR